MTRAKYRLYLAMDEEHNYNLPTIPPAPVEIDLAPAPVDQIDVEIWTNGIDVWVDDEVLEDPDL